MSFINTGLLYTSLMASMCVSISAQAFEDTKVMPKGVRRLSLRVVNTEFSEKTDGGTKLQPLARPLQKSLTFHDVLKGEQNGAKRAVLAGYLNTKGISKDSVLGNIDADLRGRMTVFAPIATLGVTDELTVALAFPIYNGATTLSMGYQKTSASDSFAASFAGDRETNSEESGRDAAHKLSNVLETINQRATTNGNARLDKNGGQWKATAPGDLTLLAKYKFYDAPVLKLATTNGAVAPTGRIDDPNIATDLPFGDGQWDLFTQLSLDQRLYEGNVSVTLNEYGKYTWQLPGEKMMRVLTPDTTSLDAPVTRTKFKLGDKVDAGTALIVDSQAGLGLGVGYNYSRKFKDIYRVTSESRAILERDTDTQLHQAEIEASYSTVPAFRRKEFAVPMETKVSYKQHIKSRNTPVTNFVQFDTGVFF